MTELSRHGRPATLGYHVHEVARLFKRRFEDAARIHGVTLPQWRALAEISRNEGITQVALATVVDSDPMTLGKVLERLEKRGLIERYADPRDSRAKLARVTSTGLKVVETAREVGFTIQASATAGLSAAEQEQLKSYLARIRDNLLAMDDAEQKETA
jgi:MarR family transcriptional regulator, transcriptional regulator for hemolysin